MHHLMGSAEVAGLLNVSRQRLTQLVDAYDDFPAPVAELAAGRIWATKDVEAWAASHPRRPGRPRSVRN